MSEVERHQKEITLRERIRPPGASYIPTRVFNSQMGHVEKGFLTGVAVGDLVKKQSTLRRGRQSSVK